MSGSSFIRDEIENNLPVSLARIIWEMPILGLLDYNKDVKERVQEMDAWLRATNIFAGNRGGEKQTPPVVIDFKPIIAPNIEGGGGGKDGSLGREMLYKINDDAIYLVTLAHAKDRLSREDYMKLLKDYRSLRIASYFDGRNIKDESRKPESYMGKPSKETPLAKYAKEVENTDVSKYNVAEADKESSCKDDVCPVCKKGDLNDKFMEGVYI